VERGRGGSNNAVQAALGFDFLTGGSVDAFYAKKKGAIAASAMSAAQVATLPAGYSLTSSVASTVSDNTTYSIMGTYSFGAPKVFAGYEHIRFSNPETPLAAGSITIGGYVLAYVNNTAFPSDKILKVMWAGGKVAFTPELEATIAWYGYRHDAFAVGKNAGCSSTVSGQCAGELNAVSGVLDYKFTKRFDWYGGVMWSQVKDGLANGYLNDSTTTITTGLRFRF